jgi:hypothetical protein
VVTVRTFWNHAEAAVAKSLLEDCEVFCALVHENANLFYPLAMPVQLQVDEDQVETAVRILDGDMAALAELEVAAPNTALVAETGAPIETPKNNPWELLAIATFFLLPGLCVLTIKYPAVGMLDWWTRRAIAAVTIIHFLGWLAVAFALCLIVAYFHLRRRSDS